MSDRMGQVIGYLILIALVGLMIGGVKVHFSEENEQRRAEWIITQRAKERQPYEAWCKLTGNEKGLSYQEWKALEEDYLLPGQSPPGGCFLTVGGGGL